MRFAPDRLVRPALGLALLLGAACVAPTTQLAPVTPVEIKAEQERQRELALESLDQEQQRLDAIAFPIMTRASELCTTAVRGRFGFSVASTYGFEPLWQPAARAVYEVGDTLQVVDVVLDGPAYRASLLAGDRLLMVGDSVIPVGKKAAPAAERALRSYGSLVGPTGTPGVPLRVRRDGQDTTVVVTPERGCDYPALVVADDALNAYSDGERIYVTGTMMRFADDDELRVILAHEFAHNAMGHIKAKQKNSLFGALLGALADVAMLGMGYNTHGYYANQGAAAGAMTFSQDFEREADYVGLYALALADVELDEAPTFWRHMAMASPDAIGLAHSHPTTAERFVRMEKAIDEIRQKQQQGLALRPTTRKEALLAAKAAKSRGAPPVLAEAPAPPPAARDELPAVDGDARPATALAPSASASRPVAQPVRTPVGLPSQAPRASADSAHATHGIVGQIAMDDMLRLRLATSVVELRPGLVRVEVGAAFYGRPSGGMSASSPDFNTPTSGADNRELYFRRLATAYEASVIELWERGRKLGEFVDGSFLLAPRSSRPQ